MKRRNWFNIKMSNNKLMEFNQKYDVFDKEFFINLAKTCDFNTFRLLCNALDKSSYSEVKSIFVDADYKEVKEIKVACNNRVNEILGEYAPLYDMLIESQRHELWNGDERYKLFSYDLPPYDVRKITKTLVRLVHEFIGKPLTIDNIKTISSLYNHGLYWSLVPELPYDVARNWETNDKDFITRNNQVQSECEAWYTLTHHLYDGNFDKAYAVMKRHNQHIH